MSALKFQKEYEQRTTQALKTIRPSLAGAASNPTVARRLQALDAVLAQRESVPAQEEKPQPVIYPKHPDADIAQTYMRRLNNANARGIAFTLSIGQLRRLLKTKRCYYTGRVLNDTDDNSPDYRTIDRIDSSKGYEPGNCVACCAAANCLKNHLFESPHHMNMTREELKRFAKLV